MAFSKTDSFIGISMKRRDFIKQASVGAVATAAAVAPAIVSADTKIKWKMVTTWPKNFPVLGTGANQLAKLITQLTDGRIKVKVYGAGELIPAFEVFDAVSRGTAQIGRGTVFFNRAFWYELAGDECMVIFWRRHGIMERKL